MDVLQKFVNDRDRVLDDSLIGFAKCYGDQVSITDCPRALRYSGAPVAGKVGVVSGGGWGHDPAFIGYLGRNMLDAVAVGETFSSPTAESFLAAFRAADAGKGVVCIYGNYPKDIESEQQAERIAAAEGITVRSVVANDDVATSDLSSRRGSSGEVLLWKIGGAAAAMGYSVDDVVRVSQKAANNMRSICVGLASCIIPSTGRPNYLIESGTMEIGASHHGLFSKDTCKLRNSDTTADIMLDEVVREIAFTQNEKAAVMISGLGNTMLCELYILYNRVHDRLVSTGVEIKGAFVGNFFTALDMMGATLTVLKLDEELELLLDYPAFAVALSPFNKVT